MANLGYNPQHATRDTYQGVIELGYAPFPKQEIAHRSPVRYKACGGGRGGGKSSYGAGDAWDLLVSYPGNVGFMGRADLEDLRRTTLKEFFKQDRGLILQHHQTQMWIDVESIDPRYPSRLYYGELKDPDSQLGTNLGFFVVDEAHEIPRRSWDNLCGNLFRLILPDGTRPPYHGTALTNPFPCWIMDLFPVTLAQQRAQRDGTWPHKNYGYFPFLAKDNPYNAPEYWTEVLPEIYKDDNVGFNRMVLGLWDVIQSGLVYPFRPFHRWKDPRPGSKARLYRHGVPVTLAIDPSGGAAPFACLVIQEFDEWVAVVDCFYVKGGAEEDLVDWLHAKPYANNISDAICDPAAKGVIDRLNRLGVQTRGMTVAKDIRAQINGVKAIMKQTPSGFARLIIDENYAAPLVTEFGRYSYKQLTEVEQLEGKHAPEKPEDENNHAINALEYWVRERRPTAHGGGLERRDPDIQVAQYYQLVERF